MSRPLQLAALVTVSFLLAGCEDWGEWGDSNRFKEDFHYTYDLAPGGRLSVESMNGSVDLIGWDQNKVEITGTKYASTEGMLQAIKIDVVSAPDSVRIRTIPPSGHRGGMGARYTIHLPRKTEIERVDTSNGRVSVDGIESASRLKTSNGSVKVTGTKGALDVQTSNASVELNDHNGPAVIHTSNGSVRADRVRGYFEASTSNASINATLADPEAGRPVKLQSSNGNITLALDAFRDNEIRAVTSNSSITLRLPADTGAQLKAKTSNSSINSEFEMKVRGTISKNSMEGTIGSGGPMIDLSTSNGAIRLQKM